ncbi:hypothetical protein MLD38_021879 [Melastoma candidum]|uniref:Uncharacterized protein n=1 Tax=Melastoma candidum TaxID=119954 RepID=A0ACB9QIE4_9MYRT|nr:hypothetical protein MLD38_021879 [Melastoma candidum]
MMEKLPVNEVSLPAFEAGSIIKLESKSTTLGQKIQDKDDGGRRCPNSTSAAGFLCANGSPPPPLPNGFDVGDASVLTGFLFKA